MANQKPPFEECYKFSGCSCNVCPLYPEAHKRQAFPGEERCKAREAIAAKYPELLSGGGLLPREVKSDRARARWAALPEAERLRRMAGLRPICPIKAENDTGSRSEGTAEGSGSGAIRDL